MLPCWLKENMEAVLVQVKECLETASFGGRPLLCIKPEDEIFSNEENLKTYLRISEDMKLGFPTPIYTPTKKKSIWQELVMLWGIDQEYTGHYNKEHGGRTSGGTSTLHRG